MLIAVAAVLAGAGASGIGQAQADTSSTAATIVVNGTDSITLSTDPTPSDATTQSTYQTALGDAITNANAKATFIAGQIGATLGAITNVTETSDSSNLCSGPILFAAGTAKPGTATPTTTPKKKHKKAQIFRTVIDPNSTSCSIEADVTVTYAITPA
jgi:uncharacterized protein YggE